MSSLTTRLRRLAAILRGQRKVQEAAWVDEAIAELEKRMPEATGRSAQQIYPVWPEDQGDIVTGDEELRSDPPPYDKTIKRYAVPTDDQISE